MPLDYAKPPPPNRARQYRIVVITCIVVIALPFAISFVRAYLTRRAMKSAAFAEQQTCLTFTSPSDRVVYEESPLDADKLLAAHVADYHRIGNHRSVGFRFGLYRKLLPPISDDNPDALVFLHERHVPNGPSRLVAVGFLHGAGTGERYFIRSLHSRIFQTTESLPILLNPAGDRLTQLFTHLSPTDLLRIYAGQPDATDPSHFTIRYAVNDRPGTIDARLLPNDTIHFQLREPPATASFP